MANGLAWDELELDTYYAVYDENGRFESIVKTATFRVMGAKNPAENLLADRLELIGQEGLFYTESYKNNSFFKIRYRENI